MYSRKTLTLMSVDEIGQEYADYFLASECGITRYNEPIDFYDLYEIASQDEYNSRSAYESALVEEYYKCCEFNDLDGYVEAAFTVAESYGFER